ncbi:plasmid replication initiator RepA [Buchnera aphidicola]|uniref:plasmid replication initiator RepA n=1 Tax=Buchnera aphidicola TaxID=9 RepID=UPI0034647452
MSITNTIASNRTKNSCPEFIIPAHHKHKIPFVLSDAIKRNHDRDLTAEVHFYLSLPPERCRRIYKSRRRALNAMLRAILYHVNVVSKQVPISASMLSEYCGLTTISKAGNKSVTRGTRALTMLRDLGFITYRQCWDRVSRRYFPSAITITERLIDLAGICPEKWKTELNNKLSNYNHRFFKKEGRLLNEYDYARRLREEQLTRCYIYRCNRKDIKNKKKRALRLEKLAVIKGENELRHLISRQVSEEFLKGFIPRAELKDLKRIVDKRIDTLKKIAKSIH